jgi:hypothetical protein
MEHSSIIASPAGRQSTNGLVETLLENHGPYGTSLSDQKANAMHFLVLCYEEIRP